MGDAYVSIAGEATAFAEVVAGIGDPGPHRAGLHIRSGRHH